MLSYARNNAENSKKLDIMIETTTSDIDYPAWPAGKAPWAVEKGGSGVPPDAVRFRMDKKPTLEYGFGMAKARNEGVNLRPLNGYRPESREEAKKMIELGKHLVKLSVNSPHLDTRDPDKQILLSTLHIIEVLNSPSYKTIHYFLSCNISFIDSVITNKVTKYK